MAAPNMNASDLDRADATLTHLGSHLDAFKLYSETPYSNPTVQDALQELRITLVNKDLDKIRQDLGSVRARLESTAVSSEADAAERKEKQATLDRAILAAEEREAEVDKKIAEAEKMMIAAQRKSDAAVVDQSKADSELAGMESMRASFDADLRQRSKRLQEEERRIMERGASLSSSEGRLAANQQLLRNFELATEKRMGEAHALMKIAQDEREAAQRNLDTAVAINHITSGAEDSVDSNSMNKLLKKVDESIRGSIDKLSSASTNVALELAEVSVGMGALKIATQNARTLASDLVDIQRATRGLVAEIDSTGKRPLSSHVEPTGKRARSVGSTVSMGSQLDIDPIGNVSGGRVIRSPRSHRGASVTPSSPGPSGPSTSVIPSAPGSSGPSNQRPVSTGPGLSHGILPGVGVCPAGIRRADDETRRTWAQIEFGTGWTMQDSVKLLEEFTKAAAKSVRRQWSQPSLDRCANDPAKCLVQDMRKLGSNWNGGEDTIANECVDCAKKSHFCIRSAWSGADPGQYDRDATNVKRWTVTKR